MSRHFDILETPLFQLLRSSTITAAVFIAGIILTVAACSKDVSSDSDDSKQVVLEAAQSSGESPWTESVTAPVDLSSTADTLDSTMVTPLSGETAPTVSGDTPGLYGGSNELSVCDRKQLSEFLNSNPDQAQAWSDVVGASDVDSYIDALTPVVLTKDTNVTNHGYTDGQAQPFQSVLQAGTAVLVDNQGAPKVRCECGNPLAEPESNAQAEPESFVGTPWPKFDPEQTITVTPAPQAAPNIVVQEVTVTDGKVVGEGQTTDVETGTDQGEQDKSGPETSESEAPADEVEPGVSDEAPAGDPNTEDNPEGVPDDGTGDTGGDGTGDTGGEEGQNPDTGGGGTEGQGGVQVEPEQAPATE